MVSRWARRGASLLAWLALGLLVVLAGAREGEARLRPYYVLRTATEAAAIKPRILFVLDTSGSMASKAQPVIDECAWERCENEAWAGTIEHEIVTGLGARVERRVRSAAHLRSLS